MLRSEYSRHLPLLPTNTIPHTHQHPYSNMSSNSIHQLLFPRSGSLTTLVFLVVMAVLAIYATSAQADGDVMGGGEGGEMTAMADAIKYLQGLDKVYGQAARPRYKQIIIIRLKWLFQFLFDTF